MSPPGKKQEQPKPSKPKTLRKALKDLRAAQKREKSQTPFPWQLDEDELPKEAAHLTRKRNAQKKLLLPTGGGLALLREWFSAKGYKPFPYQEETWKQFRNGKSGLLNVPTGAGKTYASYIGPLSELIEDYAEEPKKVLDQGLKILIVTPLRALSRDMQKALESPVNDLNLPFRVESRTGDTSPTLRARQKKSLPEVLITTPESLNLLLSYEDSKQKFSNVKAVIIDEWHELLTSKRGIQIELALARIRRFNPKVRSWALSATIANLDEAAQCAVGLGVKPKIVTSKVDRPIIIDSLIPEKIESLPWAGHLGSSMLKPLIDAIDIKVSTLVFTNVRSHAERWYQDILSEKPEWAGLMALHHGSMEKREREFVEEGLKENFIKLVICTSSLDLGVDFAPVERVFQIGSPKGIARMIQRAGRSSHRPGLPCRITCVPTQALELAEIASVRKAIGDHRIEPRLSLKKPYDVLLQHLVTCALGGGFSADKLYDEVKTTVSYSELSRQEFEWVLQMVRNGGGTLSAYPEYHKIELKQGHYIVPDKRIAQLHRFNIGTISSEASMTVAFLKGGKIGTVEESFVSRLKEGDVFTFSGRTLEFVMIRDMTAYVRNARKKSNRVPKWYGGRLPLSPSLADELRRTLERNIAHGDRGNAEIKALKPVLDAQKRDSIIPKANELLIEFLKTRNGYHLYLYPFEGRLVHEGLAALLGYRMGQARKLTVQLTVNDYGIEFLSQDGFPCEDFITPELFSLENLTHDLLGSMNMSELARRQFRDVARVAGLIYQNYPGTYKSSRQLHTSSSVLFDVFERFDPDNLLLGQARQEVLDRQFEQGRLADTLRRMQLSDFRFIQLKRPSPLAFPLMAERLGSQLFNLSNESLAERIAKMQRQWLK